MIKYPATVGPVHRARIAQRGSSPSTPGTPGAPVSLYKKDGPSVNFMNPDSFYSPRRRKVLAKREVAGSFSSVLPRFFVTYFCVTRVQFTLLQGRTLTGNSPCVRPLIPSHTQRALLAFQRVFEIGSGSELDEHRQQGYQSGFLL